ncbi:hypothetical protein [Kitasatospora sp. NPDC101183]|uniref:hypothetical protein n=1 Tax=Kitasatospora sp. NPDC101183 TaxID=3364100 RepID=UPI0038098463
MTDWKGVVDADSAVPAGQVTDALVRERSRAPADPDPLVSDGEPHAVLATWIARA